MIDQPLPSSMECLNVLLLKGLLRDKPHVRLLENDTDRFSII
jgi:hypothetical protein